MDTHDRFNTQANHSMRSRYTGRRQRAALAALLFGMTFTAVRSDAQTLAQQTRNAGEPSQHILSVNPFLPLFGYFQAEYERRLQDNLSIAVAGSHVRYDEYYTNLDIKLRLYPQDRALQGFGVAAGLGVASARPRGPVWYCDAVGECADRPERRVGAPTFSVEAQYQWLLGRTQRTAVSVGGGAKRYFFSEANRQDGRLESVLPTARFTIGYVFR